MSRNATALVFVVLIAAYLNLVIKTAEVKDNVSPAADCTEGFCTTKPEGYDELQVHIDNAIKKLSFPLKMEDRYGVEIPEYGGDSLNCRYVKKTTQPYRYKKGDTDLIIVQSDIIRQTIEEVTCETVEETDKVSDNKECFSEDLNSDIATRCKTKVIPRSLYTFNVLTREIENITYEASVWCYCQMEQEFNN